MIVVPAIDLRDGACVQLVGGSYDDERVRRADPVAVARDWELAGFRRIHIVDLDAATSRGSNADVVRAIVQGTRMRAQVGGGVRSTPAIGQLLRDGAERVIVGTRAIEDPEWLGQAAWRFPGRLIVAADVRGREVVTAGWTERSGQDVVAVIETLNALPLAGVLVTAVHKEGRMEGCDMELMETVCDASTLPVSAAGGIAGTDDLRALDECGVAQAIVGMALYTGAIDGRVAAGFLA